MFRVSIFDVICVMTQILPRRKRTGLCWDGSCYNIAHASYSIYSSPDRHPAKIMNCSWYQTSKLGKRYPHRWQTGSMIKRGRFHKTVKTSPRGRKRGAQIIQSSTKRKDHECYPIQPLSVVRYEFDSGAPEMEMEVGDNLN